MTIDLEAIGDPIYEGSVQNLYAIPGREDYMLCETTSGGSVFDVGTIFQIPNSDVTRSIFRHRVFSDLGEPECVADLVRGLRAGSVGEVAMPTEWLEGEWVEKACQEGICTHHAGMVDAKTGEVVSTGFPENPSTFNVVRRFQIIKPSKVRLPYGWGYDYTPYQGEDGFVVPLEFIVRLGITSGSSVYRKYLKMGEVERVAYARGLGAGDALKAWEYFPQPIYDLTTKYEPEDRNLNNQEALLISTLDGEQFNENVMSAILCTAHVAKLLGQMGLRLWDIKWEFAKADGSLYLIDTIDTDSLRATSTVEDRSEEAGTSKKFITHFNKQSMRDYYRIVHADWVGAIGEAKSAAVERGIPFTEVLAEGQGADKYPNTPEVDGAFLDLQTRKMEAIANFLRGDVGSEASQEAVAALASEELEYYHAGGHLEAFGKINGI